MSIKGAVHEGSEENVEHVFGNQRKSDPHYIVTEHVA